MYLQSSKLCLCISDAIAPLYNDWLWLSDLSLIAALVVFLLLRTWKPTSVVPRSSLNLDSCGYTWYMASSFKNTVSDVCAEWQCLPKVVPRDYIDHTCMTDSRAVLPEGLKVTRIQQWFPSLAWEYWEFIRLLEYFHNIILCRCWKTKVLCIYALEEIFFYMTGDSLIDFDKVVPGLHVSQLFMQKTFLVGTTKHVSNVYETLIDLLKRYFPPKLFTCRFCWVQVHCVWAARQFLTPSDTPQHVSEASLKHFSIPLL